MSREQQQIKQNNLRVFTRYKSIPTALLNKGFEITTRGIEETVNAFALQHCERIQCDPILNGFSYSKPIDTGRFADT